MNEGKKLTMRQFLKSIIIGLYKCPGKCHAFLTLTLIMPLPFFLCFDAPHKKVVLCLSNGIIFEKRKKYAWWWSAPKYLLLSREKLFWKINNDPVCTLYAHGFIWCSIWTELNIELKYSGKNKYALIFKLADNNYDFVMFSKNSMIASK